MTDFDEPRLPAEVIQLRPITGDAAELQVKQGQASCRHNSRLIDDEHRTVECASCGALLDAFAELSRVAHDHVRIFGNHARIQQETKTAEKRLLELARIEANARSRARRAGATVPSKWEMGEQVKGWLRVYHRDGRVIVNEERPSILSPGEARESARKLLQVADEAEKPKQSEAL